jgi:hypothetical protein
MESSEPSCYNPSEQAETGVMPSGSEKASTESSSTAPERRPIKPGEGGDGINEQQLLQDFFHHI